MPDPRPEAHSRGATHPADRHGAAPLRAMLVALVLTPLGAPRAGAQIAAAISAPVTDLRYEVTVDSAAVASRHIPVAVTLTVAGPGPVVLSLPAWTPGAYEMVWFSRWVSAFAPTAADGRPLTWDTMDNAMAWTRPDFALFNGTNLFLYPEGRGLNFPATVTIHTTPGWRVATGMTPGPAPDGYMAPTYHDLVDMPFFVGRFDLDSEQVATHWVRYASYPAGIVAGERRATVLRWLAQVIPPEAAVFGEIPWTTYTVMQVTDSSLGGSASGLEHQDSHVDVVGVPVLDYPFMPGLYAHEIFHSWNVKRMRPAEMVPYRYDVPQPTPWLWVSEGITDYYADLAEVRGGVIADTGFYQHVADKIGEVDAAPPVALTDASLSTWVHPTDGTGYLYYPKGSLAGLLLDIIIRDASDNRQSLDSVMRAVYDGTYKRQRGFTGVDWWGAVGRAAGGRSFGDFIHRYIDGRERYPYDSILPLAGLRLATDSVRAPRLGIATELDSGHVRVVRVEPGSSAESAGVQSGDVLVSVGDLPVLAADFGTQFRARYGAAGTAQPAMIPFIVMRGGQRLTLRGPLQFRVRVETRVVADPAASPKAIRVRNGILRGTAG